jgi:cytochrome c biogenesis protein CcmG/thiol:disulfide interchange protein DsbE
MRWALSLLAAAALVAVVVIGLTQAGDRAESSGDRAARFDLDRARQRLAGSPAPLAALHDQSNRLLGGGRAAFEKRLRQLRGHPVVVNKWASWCGPCRAELPILQQVATERGREIAFVGVNARDKRPAAQGFAARFPTPYPSYEDPDEKIARALKVPANFPATVLLDANGKAVFTHQGGYATSRDLLADIDKYLAG